MSLKNDSLEIKLLNYKEDDILRIHHMPCRIKHNGEANVEKYFEPNITTKKDQPEVLESSFRGHPLQGKTINLDSIKGLNQNIQVTGHIINEDKNCVHTFKEFQVWTYDKGPHLEEDINASLDWINFSSVVRTEILLSP